MLAVPIIPEKTRVCEWCAQSIPQQAIKCPFCHKWRNDINKARQQVIAGLLGIIVFGFLALVLIKEALNPPPGAYFARSNHGHPWHENPGLDSPNAIALNAITNKTADDSWHFSIKKFLSSSEGWVLIMWIICIYGSLLFAERGQKILKRNGLTWPFQFY
ncbi:MAG: hypothetical protein ABSB25_00180 [Sedimentisphaerales bacterium]|jgi:hypothetical protein